MSNEITAFFKGRVGVAESVYQNDYGMVLIFDKIELPAHFDCYFSVTGSNTSIPVIGADNRVAIPNAVLSTSGKVEAHIPLHTGQNDSEVEYIAYFKVIARARPEDDGTPKQMTAVERAIALLQEPISNIAQIVDEALGYSNSTIIDCYVTPEMYGAVGDGVEDDSDAVEEASKHGIVIGKPDSQYYIGRDTTLENDAYDLNFIIGNTASLVFTKDDLAIAGCNFQNDTYAPSEGRGKWMVVARRSKRVTVEGCYFHKGVSALYIDRCSEINVNNNVFEDLRQYNLNGYGVLFIESKNAVVSNNVFIDVARHSIYISKDATSTYNEDILIEGNIFKWDDSVYGNSTGFENTINILPAKNITILNNKFVNMFSIASLGTSTIYDNGSEITAAPEHITIIGNKGSFADSPRIANGGVIFVPGVSVDVQVKDVLVSDNNIELDQGIFFNIDNPFDGIIIKNNVINYGTAYYSQVFCMPDPNASGESGDLTISGNYVRKANDIFCVRTTPHAFGNVVISDNDVDVVELGNFKDGTTLTSLKIINNIIKSSTARTYWSSAVVGELTLLNNIANQMISLWLAPTTVISTDPIFQEYGYDNANPSSCMPGAIHTHLNGAVYIRSADNSWVQV